MSDATLPPGYMVGETPDDPPEPIQIAGALVATTKDIRRIARQAAEDGDREHELTPGFLKGLDPDGFHILCTRDEGLGLDFQGEHSSVKLDLTLGTHIQFEGLFKLIGQQAPVTRWITLRVVDALALPPAEDRRHGTDPHPVDGETQN